MASMSVVHYQMGTKLTWDRGLSIEAASIQGNVVTEADGTSWEFAGVPSDYRYHLGLNSSIGMTGLLKSVTYPNGEKLTYSYTDARKTRSIVSNLGYMLHFEYSGAAGTEWSKATVINLRYDFCDPNASVCTGLSVSWPAISLSRVGSTWYGNDEMGRVNVATNGDQPWSVTSPEGRRIDWWSEIQGFHGGACDVYTGVCEVRCPGVRVTTQVQQSALGAWRYRYTTNDDCRMAPAVSSGTSINPESATTTVTINGGARTDALNRTTLYDWQMTPSSYAGAMGQAFKLKSVQYPEGNRTEYLYDNRWNIVRTEYKSKLGIGGASRISTATYRDCTGPSDFKICNKPQTTTDFNGAASIYTYDQNSGELATKTLPSVPSPAGLVQFKTRNSYSPYFAKFRRSALTAPEPASTAVYKLSRTSNCLTKSLDTCVGTADEVVRTFTYDDNLLLLSETTSAGDGSISATVQYEYDAVGNRTVQTGPLPGQATRYYYNAKRELTATIGPDPDGAGSLAHPIVVTTYDRDGLPVLVERGNSPTATLSSYTVLSATRVDYDTAGRKVNEALLVGGALASLTSRSYDSANRVLCEARRMNLSSSLSASACQLGVEAGYGPDRITRYFYDVAGQLRQVQDAVGTTLQRNERSQTFTSNGKMQTIADSNGNLTTFTYDGHDRLARTLFPHSTSAGLSNVSDYDEIQSYDGNSNPTVRRLRDGRLLTLGYDAQNRNTSRQVAAQAWGEASVTRYVYDSANQLWSATDSNGSYVGRSYNALGCQTTEADSFGTKLLSCDLAGRRSSLSYTDGHTVRYSSLLNGALSNVREDGGIALVTFFYDNLGRRTLVERGNGANSTYNYAPGTWTPSTLKHTVSGAFVEYGYASNPAGQIVSLRRDNDNYAWPLYSNQGTGYAVNGLNQITTVGGLGIQYDARGNLTSALGTTWTYTLANKIATASTSSATAYLLYDAIGRLSEIQNAGAIIRFEYLGQALIGEWSATSTLLRRYVPSFTPDEQILWYEGAGKLERRWFHTDHQGSSVAVSNEAGLAIAINTYDEYGTPAASNLGRHQYTGQRWIPELQLADYKARMYNPKLGRFMQADPVRFDSGDLNLYAYVTDDPLNRTDPTGETPLDLAFLGADLISLAVAAYSGHDVKAAAVDVLISAVAVAIPVPASGQVVKGIVAAHKAVDAAKGVGEANSLANAARLRGQLAGKEIAGGHAFEKHVLDQGEFKGLGIRTREHFANHIEDVVNNPTASRQLSGGRSAYWQDSTGTVVIRNPRAADGGTAFQPPNGRAYYNGLR